MTDCQLLARVEGFARPFCEQDVEDPCLWKNHVQLVRLEVQVVQAADVLGTLFDEAWQAYSRKTMWPEKIRQLYARALSKIRLESARKIAEPQIAKLEALLA